MAMKILNQFIDDFVGVFQYRFMDTFQYFKERKKSKYLGDRFEEWVVKNSNISKDGYSDLCDKKIFWRLLDWRGDKYIEGYRPLSSSSPDLLMECVTTTSTIHEVGDIIAVECKWRSKIGFYLDIKGQRTELGGEYRELLGVGFHLALSARVARHLSDTAGGSVGGNLYPSAQHQPHSTYGSSA